MSTIVDPTNPNVALVDGEVGYAVRMVKIADRSAPNISELSGGAVVGYASPQDF